MNLSVDVDKRKKIIILGKCAMQGLEDTTLISEK